METKRLRKSFFMFLLKIFFFSVLCFLLLDKYLALGLLSYFIILLFLKYLISHKKYNKIIKIYLLFQSLSKKHGVLNKREIDIIQKVIESYSNKVQFKEWIDGHEFLYSEKEIKMMQESWVYLAE